MITLTIHLITVYLNIDVLDYNERIDGRQSISDFINNSSDYKSTFMKYANVTDIFLQVISMEVAHLIYLQEMMLNQMILIFLLLQIFHVILTVLLQLQLNPLPLMIQFTVIILKLKVKMILSLICYSCNGC